MGEPMNGLAIWRKHPYGKIKALYRDRVATVAAGLLDRYERKNTYAEGSVIEFARNNLRLARSSDGEAWLRITECIPDLIASETTDLELRDRITPDAIGTCLLAAALSGSDWARFRLSWHLGLHGHAELSRAAVDAYELAQFRAFSMITALGAHDAVLPDIVAVNIGEVKRMVEDIEGSDAARTGIKKKQEQGSPANRTRDAAGQEGDMKYKGIHRLGEFLGRTATEPSASDDDFMPGLKVIDNAYPSPPQLRDTSRPDEVSPPRDMTRGSSGIKIMNWLSLWRSEPFSDILVNHKNALSGISDGLLELAELKFSASGSPFLPSALLRDSMGAARLLDAHAWLQLAEALPDHLAGLIDQNAPASLAGVLEAKKTDIEGTCLLLASAYGNRWARYMLSYHLAIHGHADLARQAVNLSEIERCFTPYFVLRVNGGEASILAEYVTENRAEIAAHIRRIEEQGKAPPTIDWDKVQPQETGRGRSKAPNAADDREASRPKLAWERTNSETAAGESSKAASGPIAFVLRSSIPLPHDRDYRKLVEDANRILPRVPLREAPDPDEVAASLGEEFPWMTPAIETVRSHLVLAGRLGGTTILPPLVLVGPPGCGKSRFARRLAETLNLPHVRLSCGGITDNRILAGTARGWASQSPSLPVTVMMRYRVANAAIVLDEIEKAGGGSRSGRIDLTLLGMVERETARDYFDEGLSAEVDISRINWIFTSNDRSRISPLLRSRLDFIEIGQPGPRDFDAILAGVLWDIAKSFDVLIEELPDLDPVVVAEMRRGFAEGRLTARQTGKLVWAALVAAADADRYRSRH
ncbi:hypothetical protein N826_25455 [Skermanella aerolata KACC 11604]|nr:hypothetical protein N826_25455 [Skermanella aerolata KACC 11604]